MGEAWKETLVAQLDHVREWTLMSCRGLKEESLVTVPEGAKNHILWELGHICWTQNHMVSWGCAGGERFPTEWTENFGFGSKATPSMRDYPPLVAIQRHLEDGRQEMRAYIQSLSYEDLRSPPMNLSPKSAPDKLSALIHCISHEAFHVGKASLLRTILGLPSVSELYLQK